MTWKSLYSRFRDVQVDRLYFLKGEVGGKDWKPSARMGGVRAAGQTNTTCPPIDGEVCSLLYVSIPGSRGKSRLYVCDYDWTHSDQRRSESTNPWDSVRRKDALPKSPRVARYRKRSHAPTIDRSRKRKRDFCSCFWRCAARSSFDNKSPLRAMCLSKTISTKNGYEACMLHTYIRGKSLLIVRGKRGLSSVD